MKSSNRIYWDYVQYVKEQSDSFKEEIKKFIVPRIFMDNIFDLVKIEFTQKFLDFKDKFYMRVPFSLRGSILGIMVQLETQIIWRELYDYPLEVVSPQII